MTHQLQDNLGFHELNNIRRIHGQKLLEPTGTPVGNQRYTNLLHAENTGQDMIDRSRRFKWDDCPTAGYANWRFPGQGEAYGTCGTFYIMGCLEHNPGHGKLIKQNCGRAECPKCSDHWRSRAVARAVDRLEAGRGTRLVNHFTVSSPPSTWDKYGDKKNYSKMRRKTVSTAKMAGIRGGMIIFHSYRGNKKAGWRWAPHFHLIGVGWVRNVKTDLKYQKALGGWLVKNHGIRRGPQSIGGTVKYQLSHAGIKKGYNVVSWFGSMAWNKLHRDPEPPPPRETCPICGGELHRIIFWGTGPNPFAGDGIDELNNLDTVNWSYEA